MIAFSYQNGTTPIKRTGRKLREDDEYHKVAVLEEAMQKSNDLQSVLSLSWMSSTVAGAQGRMWMLLTCKRSYATDSEASTVRVLSSCSGSQCKNDEFYLTAVCQYNTMNSILRSLEHFLCFWLLTALVSLGRHEYFLTLSIIWPISWETLRKSTFLEKTLMINRMLLSSTFSRFALHPPWWSSVTHWHIYTVFV